MLRPVLSSSSIALWICFQERMAAPTHNCGVTFVQRLHPRNMSKKIQTVIYLISRRESRKEAKSSTGFRNQVEFLTTRESMQCQKHKPAGILKYHLKDTLHWEFQVNVK